MDLGFTFFFNSILLGLGLSMDAFSVSVANGLNEPKMRLKKLLIIAFTFAFFQAAMPLIGWVCVHTAVNQFETFEKFIPYIALAILCYIGISMIISSIKSKEEPEKTRVGVFSLLMQGVATSIDALSVGFTISEYDFFEALLAALIIAAVTFVICSIGLKLGKKFSAKLSSKATLFGGIILVLIGVEIFIDGILS